MKVFDHTIYAPNRTPKFEKTSALSAPSVVDTYQYSYVVNSNLIGSVTFPNGLVTTKTYETNRNLIDKVENNFNGTARSVYDFTNDAIGRRSDVAKSGTAFGTADKVTYNYNDRSEVTGATATNDTKYNFGYNFDNLGNRISSSTSESGSVATTNYSANALNQYTAVGTQAPTYDDDGNMTGTWLTQPDGNKADSDLYYNAENRLVKVIGNGQKLEFTYEQRSCIIIGLRPWDAESAKNVYSGSESAWTLEKQTTFTYDGWNLIEEVEASVYDSSNSAFTQFRTSNYNWGLDLSQTIQGAGGVSGLLSLDKGTATYYYTYDANGNVSELIDTAGVVQAHYEYSPFGKVVHKSGPLADKNPFQFSTKYLDNETQLYYYGYRYYNPESGRLINRDPISELRILYDSQRRQSEIALKIKGQYLWDKMRKNVISPSEVEALDRVAEELERFRRENSVSLSLFVMCCYCFNENDCINKYELLGLRPSAIYRPVSGYGWLGWGAPAWHALVKYDDGSTDSSTGPEDEEDEEITPRPEYPAEKKPGNNKSWKEIEDCLRKTFAKVNSTPSKGLWDDLTKNNCGNVLKNAFDNCGLKDPTPWWLAY